MVFMSFVSIGRMSLDLPAPSRGVNSLLQVSRGPSQLFFSKTEMKGTAPSLSQTLEAREL